MLTADADADLEGALFDWRQHRRSKRIADVHWIDVVYQAYLTGILGLVAVAVAASFVGDVPLGAEQVDRLVSDGPPWIGGVAALAMALGLRSGSRGGPLALERAEVRHVLLAPVDRTTALRGPALRQLRFLGFVGAVTGGIAGYLATRRLPGTEPAWIATGALAGLTVVGLGAGSALLSGGLRLPRPWASFLGLGLLAGALADATGAIPYSPTRSYGDLVLWPLHLRMTGVVPVVIAALLVAAGLAMVGRTSLEAAERRSSLVGQLRFAATMQDLRTVIVLRRQLAMELPRLRPWVRLPVAGTSRWPVFVRGLQGVLRWPAARVGRLMLLGALSGFALRAAWTGTSPLVVLAGVAMFVAGLDAVEPLAQEVDHPSRRDSVPRPAAAIHLRHVPVGVLSMVLTAGTAALVAAGTPGSGDVPAGTAAVLLGSLALGGLGGALVSVLAGPVSVNEGWSLAPPEAQGIRLAVRTAWPPAIATFGAAPVLAARSALDDGLDPAAGALPVALGVAVLFALVLGWVRVRDDIKAWFQASMAMAAERQEQSARTEVDED